VAGGSRGIAGTRLWRAADVAVLLVLNAVAVTVVALAWAAAKDKTALADQATNVAVAVGGLVAGALGNAWLLLAGKSAVAGRATVLLRPGGVGDGGATPVAFVVPLPAPVTTAPANGSVAQGAGESGRQGWCRLYWDRLLAMAAGVAGLVALLVGWVGLSDVLIDHRQVPWVLGGSFLGLWLLGVAGTAWLAAVLRDQWSALSRIAGRLAELGVPSVAEIPAPALPSRNSGSGGSELRGADGIPSLL
jgi:hypothetical protein